MESPPIKLKRNNDLVTANPINSQGIKLGDCCYWNPETLPNQHIAVIGASDSDKTQTLKAIASAD